MLGFVITLHVVVSVLLIGAILLQPGAKGGGLGAAFGGGSANSAFGARGAAPFLAKLTYWLAGGFLLCSLGIELLIASGGRSTWEKKQLEQQKSAAPAQTPAVPAQPEKK